MIDQARISELRRIYGGSNNEAYRTVNQLLDEIERLNEERQQYQSPLIATEMLMTGLAKDIANQTVSLGMNEPKTILGQPVEEVSIDQPTEPIQLTELTEEIAQRVIEPANKRRKEST